MPFSTPVKRRTLLAMFAAPLVLAGPAVAAAPNVAESFVDENIHKGLEILRDKRLSNVQRRDQFEGLLLTLVDVRRIALFTLGQYRRSAPPADVEAFVNAFKNYAAAAYQSYFAKYTDQTLKVIGSTSGRPPISLSRPIWWSPVPASRRRKWISGCAPIPASRCLWMSPIRASGCRWSSATSSSPSWARTTALRCPPSLIAHLSDLAVNLGKG